MGRQYIRVFPLITIVVRLIQTMHVRTLYRKLCDWYVIDNFKKRVEYDC